MLAHSLLIHAEPISIAELNENTISTHRKDIDGLRAIAVLSVVFYHLFGNFFAGGFIGVDVFFVISGYLISKILIDNLERGHFSFKEFYIRRMRRILPAFVFVLFISGVVGFLILTPPDLKNFSKSALASILSVSNLYFWKSISIGYFATDANVLPLLHTWSLSVEEQFYLVWPVVLFIIFHGLNRQGKRAWLGPITMAIGLISFFLSFYFRKYELMAFYTPITRAFELLMGSSLAIYWGQLKRPTSTRAFFLSLLGLFLIFYSMVFFEKNDYSIIYILLSCTGTVLLLYAGVTKSSITRCISFSIITFWGTISYSLYLWHWPIIAYTHYLGINIDLSVGAIIFFVSSILSVISWYFIEQKCRNKFKLSFNKILLLFLVLPIFLSFMLLMSCWYIPNFGFNTTSPGVQEIIDNYEGPFTGKKCIDAPTLKPRPFNDCSLGDLSKINPDVLIVGDSHAMALSGMLNILLKDAHLKGYVVTQSGTPFILGALNDWRENLPMKRNDLILTMIQKNHYKYIILGGFWNYYPDSILKNSSEYSDKSYMELKQGLEHAIEMIVSNNSIPVLISDVPPLLNIPVQCGFLRVGLNKCENSIDTINKIQADTKNILLSIKNKYPDLIFLDLNPVMCQANQCSSAAGGIPLYMTGQSNSHLNYAGSSLVGDIYLHNYINPLSKTD